MVTPVEQTSATPKAPKTPQTPAAQTSLTPEVPKTPDAAAPPATTDKPKTAAPLQKGHFRCGKHAQCKAQSETCCEDLGSCVPRGSEHDVCVRTECEVSSDCARGQSCCSTGYISMPPPFYQARCESTRCRESERCRKGTCPSGEVCWEGACRNPNVQIQCGDARCRGNKPWCNWDYRSKVGTCVGLLGGDRFNLFRCDDDRDCLANERCWLGMLGSWCCRGESCYDHAATTKFVGCKTKRDCPKLEGMVFECVEDPELLPQIGRHCKHKY